MYLVVFENISSKKYGSHRGVSYFLQLESVQHPAILLTTEGATKSRRVDTVVVDVHHFGVKFVRSQF